MKQLVSGMPAIEAFLHRAQVDGYNMEPSLLDPAIGPQISAELARNNCLRDQIELRDTQYFDLRGMQVASALHRAINSVICDIEGEVADFLPYFSVRVFPPHDYATTIHRNDEAVGPWVVGIPLKGKAVFSVYGQSQLPPDEIIPLTGAGSDPVPEDSIDTVAGSAWALYTAAEQKPHSGGLVTSNISRELLLLYGLQ